MTEKEIEEKNRRCQKWLLKTLTEEYYCKPVLILLLCIPGKRLDILLRKLKEYPGMGYRRLDIILGLTGGKLFEEETIKN